METKKKYVVLEHLLLPNRGFRFWTMNTDNNTKLLDGTIAYKEILFTNDDKEAIKVSQDFDKNLLPSMKELEDHYKQEIERRNNEQNL